MCNLTLKQFFERCDIEELNCSVLLLYKDYKIVTRPSIIDKLFLTKRIFLWYIRDNRFIFWLED